MHIDYAMLIALCKERREKGGKCRGCPYWTECIVFKTLCGVEPYDADVAQAEDESSE